MVYYCQLYYILSSSQKFLDFQFCRSLLSIFPTARNASITFPILSFLFRKFLSSLVRSIYLSCFFFLVSLIYVQPEQGNALIDVLFPSGFKLFCHGSVDPCVSHHRSGYYFLYSLQLILFRAYTSWFYVQNAAVEDFSVVFPCQLVIAIFIIVVL